MAEHQALASGRRLAVAALDDLTVRAAHPYVERLDEQVAVFRLGIGKLGQLCAVGLAGDDRHRPHDLSDTRDSAFQRSSVLLRARVH